MPDGLDVAIKRLVGHGTGRIDHGFLAEIQTLGRIRHPNIVRLLGYVSNKDTNMLRYEYMPNGSLGEMLHGSKVEDIEVIEKWKNNVEEEEERYIQPSSLSVITQLNNGIC
ncbi:hypothetical protein REPUB_Repub18cG0104400 [Reevesia pubescens]